MADLLGTEGGVALTDEGGTILTVEDAGTVCYFTPPTEDTVPQIDEHASAIANRLFRYYPTRKRGRAVWQLPDGTFSFDQPWPVIFPADAAQGNLWPNPNNLEQGVQYVYSNLVEVTALQVFYGGHVYVIDANTCQNLQFFLSDNGYNPDDWLSHPQGVLAET